MPAQDELFQLIKSLNPSEKRYFKTNAKKGGETKSNYVQLFDAMDAQGDEYDEQKLKQKHAKKAFVKYLSAEKKYLREQIMKQMRGFHAESAIDNKVYELLQDESFYCSKGLRKLREKSIQKAKDLTTQHEIFHLLQEVLERELAYVEEFEKNSLTEPVLKLLIELSQLYLRQQTFLELSSKNREVFGSYRSGADTKDPVLKHKLDAIMVEVEMLRPRILGSFRLQRAFFHAYSNYHNFYGNHEESFKYTLLEYNLFKEYAQFMQTEVAKYRICLANLIARAQSAGKSEQFLRSIAELKSIPSATFNEEGEVFQNVYFLEHLHYINTGEFEKAESLIPDIENGLTKYENKINKARLLSFLYNIMIMYFLMHRFKEASSWAERILEDKSEIKQEVTTITRILFPIIHFELGHDDLVEGMTRSAYRYLKSKKRLHDFERLLINYLKQMPFSVDEREFKEKLEAFRLSLNELNTPGFGTEEINLWVNSRVTGKQMHELLKAQS